MYRIAVNSLGLDYLEVYEFRSAMVIPKISKVYELGQSENLPESEFSGQSLLRELINDQTFDKKMAKTQFTITEQKHQQVFNRNSKLKKLIKKVEEEIFSLRQQIHQDSDGKFYKLQQTGCKYFWA